MRFDKRSVGKSSGNYDTATFEDFASDTLAGVEYLKTRPEINPHQIGLIGHSEGGMTAAFAATKSPDIAFILLMATPGVNWEKLLNKQIILLQEADGVDKETICMSSHLLQQIFIILKEEKDREKAILLLQETFNASLEKFTPTQIKIFQTYYGTAEEQMKLFNSVWFRYSLSYEPTDALKQIKISILALNGELDKQVSSKQNLLAIAQALEEAGHKDYTIKELPNLNHAFQTCQTGSVKEYELIEETISPVALNLMSQWILEKTNRS